MRRDQKDRDDKGRVKFRYIEFEMDASDSTLQDTLRNITTAIGKSTGSHGRVHDSNPRQLQQALETLNSAETDPVSTQDEQPNSETEGSESQTDTRAKRSVTRPPEILNDLDLTSGNTPFKECFKSKNPTTESQRYLVIAGWLKQVRGIDEITMDHVYTCYRLLGLQTPKDTTAPLRAMKKNGWFNKGTVRGRYALNQIGEHEFSNLGKEN
jgi:hypothetical protein